MNNPIKHIAILGSTGSIGTQTLDIIREYPDRFKATVIVAGNNVDLLISQALEFKPKLAVIANEAHYAKLRDALASTCTHVAAGSQAVADAMTMPEVDTVVTAAVGYSGLQPTIAAIRAGKRIALANKETLVVAGQLVTNLLKKSASTIIPVDSEHSAIYQCLVGEDNRTVRQLIITASGGPFRTKTRQQLADVKVADALAHPNWSMGAKITIDSATMLNKAFEIIEARWLFDVRPEQITAVVHPQSIVHSMVEFVDGAVKAQLGLPDMHLPIRYALGDASRLSTDKRGLSIVDYSKLEFFEPDSTRFPLFAMGHFALRNGGNTACVINAANEIAVASFLKGEIPFLAIETIIDEAIAKTPYIVEPSYEDYVATNSVVRQTASEHAKRITSTFSK